MEASVSFDHDNGQVEMGKGEADIGGDGGLADIALVGGYCDHVGVSLVSCGLQQRGARVHGQSARERKR